MNKFLTAVFAATLLSSAALADEKTITLVEQFEPVTGDRRLDGVWQPLDGMDDDINPEFTKKFPGITRNREFFISGTSSCRGWVPVQDIVDGKCLNGKVKVD